MGSNKLLSHKSYPVSMKFMGSPEFNGHNNSTWFILRDNDETGDATVDDEVAPRDGAVPGGKARQREKREREREKAEANGI